MHLRVMVFVTCYYMAESVEQHLVFPLPSQPLLSIPHLIFQLLGLPWNSGQDMEFYYGIGGGVYD